MNVNSAEPPPAPPGGLLGVPGLDGTSREGLRCLSSLSQVANVLHDHLSVVEAFKCPGPALSQDFAPTQTRTETWICCLGFADEDGSMQPNTSGRILAGTLTSHKNASGAQT